MKKTIFTICLMFSGFAAMAAGAKNSNGEGPVSSVPLISKPAKMQCCRTAVGTYNGNTITCTACADTCDGPQGAEAKAADCLMDLTVQEIGG